MSLSPALVAICIHRQERSVSALLPPPPACWWRREELQGRWISWSSRQEGWDSQVWGIAVCCVDFLILWDPEGKGREGGGCGLHHQWEQSRVTPANRTRKDPWAELSQWPASVPAAKFLFLASTLAGSLTFTSEVVFLLNVPDSQPDFGKLFS